MTHAGHIARHELVRFCGCGILTADMRDEIEKIIMRRLDSCVPHYGGRGKVKLSA